MGARHSLGSERNVQGACPQLPPNLSGLNGVTGLLWSLTEFTRPFFVLLPLALKGRTQDSAPNLSQTAHFECHLILLLASRPTWPGLVFSREAWHSRAGRPLRQGGVGSPVTAGRRTESPSAWKVPIERQGESRWPVPRPLLARTLLHAYSSLFSPSPPESTFVACPAKVCRLAQLSI